MAPNVNKIEGQTFVGANVQIDGGTAYVNCRFVKCNIVITGMAPVQIATTAFEECRWSFAGPAGNVLSFLKAMHQSAGKEMVEGIWREICGVSAPGHILNPALKSGGKVQ